MRGRSESRAGVRGVGGGGDGPSRCEGRPAGGGPAGSGFLNEVRPSVSPVPPFPGGPWPRRGGPRRGSAGVRRERPGAARSSGEGPAGPPSAAPGLPRHRRAGGAGRVCCVRVGGEGRGGGGGGRAGAGSRPGAPAAPWPPSRGVGPPGRRRQPPGPAVAKGGFFCLHLGWKFCDVILR